MSWIRLELGDSDGSRRYAEQGLQYSQTHNRRLFEGILRVSLGAALLKSDPSQADQAKQHILQGIKSSDEIGARYYSGLGYLSLGEFYADLSQKEEAQKALKEAQGMFQEMGMTGFWSARTEKALERLKAQ